MKHEITTSKVQANEQCELDGLNEVTKENEEDIEHTCMSPATTAQPKSLINKIEQVILKVYKFLIVETVGKCTVGLIFAVYIGLSVYYACQIREGMDVADLVADKSYYRAYMHDNMESVSMSPVVMFVIDKPIDYTSRKTRSHINSIIKRAQNITGMKNDFKIDWLDRFDGKLVDYRRSNYSDALLDDILDDLTPFSNDIIVRYNSSLKRNQIYASRFYLQYEQSFFSSLDAKPMNDLYDLCASVQSDISIVPYSVAFKYFEQFEQALPNVIQSFIVAGEAMYFISLVFVPDIITALCIILSMASIMIGLVGCIHLWGLTLSSITMIQLVMSIGFCVDFSAHLAHAFLANVGKGSRSQRAFKACIHTGLPVFNSAISTIFGVMVLAFCESYIFVSFFKTMFVVMCLCVLNSMLFLPVLLSLIGPHWSRHKILSSICDEKHQK
jgi:hypothetical protein